MEVEQRVAVHAPVGRHGRQHSTFESLKNVQFRPLFTSGLLVFMAVQAQQIARGDLAYELSGESNAGLGLVYLGFGIPMLLMTPIGGVAADRLPKRTVMVVAQAFIVASSAWIAIAGVLGALAFWMLVGASVLQGIGFSVFGPTRVAFTAEVVPRSMLPNAVALTQMSMNSTRVFAPAFAGALIGIRVIGAEGVYVITTVFNVLSFLVTFRLPVKPAPTGRPKRTVAGEFIDGIRYVRDQPRLGLLVLASFMMVMAGWPYLAFLRSVADLFDRGASGYAVMSSVSAVAALAVTLWLAGRADPGKAWTHQMVSGFALSVGLVLMALAPSFALELGALLVVGAAASGYQAMNNTLVLTESEPEYQGRVQSLLMLSFSGFGLAALPIGALADAVGLRQTLVGMGVICLLTMTTYALASRRVSRRLIDIPAG